MKSITNTARGRLRTAVPANNGLCMQICLFLDPTRVYRWHVWLAEALAATGRYEIVVELATEKRPLPIICSLLLELERLVYGRSGESALGPASDRIKPFLRHLRPAGGFDTVIDLTGGEGRPPAAQRILVPYFDGLPGEIGAIACLIRRKVPGIEVEDSTTPGRPFTARPAVTDREILAVGLDNILSSAVCLLTKAALSGGQAAARPGPANGLPFRKLRRGSTGGAMLWASASVAQKAMRLLKRLAVGGRTWGVAWRPVVNRALLHERAGVFSRIRDDGRRYYADPFPFQWQDRTFLFVEEYVYATRRGCISVSEIREDGTVSTPQPVLEEPYHLSYPFVFEQGGQIWMIPESGAARGVYLYRAEAFPFRWKREACLISDSEAYDATLATHGGLFWLFSSERNWRSSSWDTVALFHADRLHGEWRPHQGNPILIDSSLSRPAGELFHWNQAQVRPVQDCSREYGGAVLLCRIDTLSKQAFAQTVIGRIHCGPHGCHTYNQGRIEVIDAFAPRSVERIKAFYDPVFAEAGSIAAGDRPPSAPGPQFFGPAAADAQTGAEMQSRHTSTV
jgi:hypothetical protein